MLAIAGGIALSILWIIRDPGWTAVFRSSAIVIGFVPIPGVLIGILLQLVPAVIGLVGGMHLWNER